MFTKLDKALFKICEYLVLRRVKKSKFKKHKYNVEDSWYQFELIFLICATVFDLVTAISHGRPISGVFGFVLWLPAILMKILSIRALRELIETYDWIWLNRKNPVVYNAIKDLCEEMLHYEESRRIKALKIYIVCMVILAALLFLGTNFYTNLWLVVSYPLHMISMYNRYVFDLEPPEEKKKEESDAKLTDLMQRQLQKLFNDFAPKPI